MAFEPRTAGDPATAKVPRKRAAARALEAAAAAASPSEASATTSPSPFGNTRPPRVRKAAVDAEPGNSAAASVIPPAADAASGGFTARTPRARRPSTSTMTSTTAVPSPDTPSPATPSPAPLSTTASLSAAPSVEEPATLLRDDRISQSATTSQRRGARARLAPASAGPAGSASAAGAPLDEETADPVTAAAHPAPGHISVPAQAAPAKTAAAQQAQHFVDPHAAQNSPAARHQQPHAAPTVVAAGDPRAPDPDLDASHEAVVISLGGGRYGIPMDAVDEVGRPPAVTRLPGLPAWLAGVANWRGRVLAVLDLRPLLAAPQLPLGRTGRLVVCTLAGVTIGLVTEEVEGVVTIDRDATEQPLVTLGGQAATLVAGQVGHARGPIALLDLDAVFALRTQLPRARRAG